MLTSAVRTLPGCQLEVHFLQAVSMEWARLDKDVLTDEQQVSDTLQKEQIETEGVDSLSSRR